MFSIGNVRGRGDVTAAAMTTTVTPDDETTTTDATDANDATNATLLRERARVATELLEAIDANRGLLALLPEDESRRLLHATRVVSDPDPRARRRLVKASKRQRKAALAEQTDKVLASTGIRELRRKPVFTTPNYFRSKALPEPAPETAGPTLTEEQLCYVCKVRYQTLHHFYDQLCPACADLNFAKRTELADLSGRVALLTGGRVKIGYQAGLKLLRAGAHLIVTTRFPRDSAARYAAEPDFADWSHRLEIYGLDLRHTPSVEAFCRQVMEKHDRLDFIINNACQTVRRPPAFYEHMMERETAALHTLSADERKLLADFAGLRGYHMLSDGSGAALERSMSAVTGLTHSAELSQVPLLPEDHHADGELFPQGVLDQDLQQVDLRGRNSWRLLMAEVSSVELLEVQLVNAVAPFVLNARLKPLMLRTMNRDKHIVNVSAVEGQFYRTQKTIRHPHTNMAKAALNMMTRTAAADYYADGIHMNSVDTGWVTDEDPAAIAARKTIEHRFHPPLDIVDGAARIVDPIISGINSGRHVWGQFLKDYKPTDW
jgi:NAD(P)-dependent dehydrogenase (short-subunit alcohol dehydrogenase family)